MGWEAGAILGSSAMSIFGASEANRRARRSARAANQIMASEGYRDRVHDLYMSNTSHQRAVADLEAAGLNPLLALHKGAPGGGAGGGFSAATPNEQNELEGLAASAQAAKQMELAVEDRKSTRLNSSH